MSCSYDCVNYHSLQRDYLVLPIRKLEVSCDSSPHHIAGGQELFWILDLANVAELCHTQFMPSSIQTPPGWIPKVLKTHANSGVHNTVVLSLLRGFWAATFNRSVSLDSRRSEWLSVAAGCGDSKTDSGAEVQDVARLVSCVNCAVGACCEDVCGWVCTGRMGEQITEKRSYLQQLSWGCSKLARRTGLVRLGSW